MAIDKRLQVFDSEGNPVDYDILASDVKFLPDGKDLPTKLAEMEEDIEEAKESQGGYTPPQGGIPATDLAPAVQTSLGKADTAYQKPASGIPASDLATGVIPDISGKADKSEMSVVPGTGSNADKTTITLKQGTSATVLTQHQDVSQFATKSEVYDKTTADGRYVQPAAMQQAIDAAVDGIIAGDTHVVSLDEVEVVDGHDSNSSLAAGSARDVRELCLNLQALFNNLAGIAFTNGKPNWITVAKPTYTLAYSLSGCTADVSAGTVTEGYLKIILTPTNASDAFTSITVNDKSVTATPVEGSSNGSVYIEITVNQNIAVAATASEGKNIDFTGSSNCQINKQSVANNTDLSATISANQHYTLPDTITVKVGTSTLSTSNYTYTRSADNKTATLLIDKQYITDDITIICTAVVMGSISVAFSGTNVAWTDDNGDAVTSPLTLYVDDRPYTLHCHPTIGNAMSQEPSITTGTATNSWTPDGNGYKLVLVAADSDDLTITASAASAHSVNVNVKRISALQEFNDDVTVVPTMTIINDSTTGTTVSNAAPVQDNAQYSGVVSVGSGYGIWSVKVMMGTDDITALRYNPSTHAIDIPAVTDDVTITVTVREAVNGVFAGASLFGRKGPGARQWNKDVAGQLVKDDDWCVPVDVIEIPAGATKMNWVFGANCMPQGDIAVTDSASWRRTLIHYGSDIVPFNFYTISSVQAISDGQRERNLSFSDTPDLNGGSMTTKYIRVSFNTSMLSQSKLQYTIDGSTWIDLWVGSEHIINNNNNE